MNPTDSDRWKSEVLDEILAALAASAEIKQCLVFKGARILNAHLGGGRQSLDLDSNLIKDFVEKHPDRGVQSKLLELNVKRAVDRQFEGKDPVRFQLMNITVRNNPPNTHPMGWNAFILKLNVADLTKPNVKSLPAIEIDVAAPEELLDTSISTLTIGKSEALAYSLERIAGEKMRAFLSSLPARIQRYRRTSRYPNRRARWRQSLRS